MSQPADTYPREGQWVLQKRPGLTIEVYSWTGEVLRTTLDSGEIIHPVSGAPLLVANEDETLVQTNVSLSVDEDHYTQGTLRFDPPVENELEIMRLQAHRTPEENARVTRPDMNFSSWSGWGPEMLEESMEAVRPYTLSYGGGSAAGLFGCGGWESMGWAASWSRTTPWIFRKELAVAFYTGTAETPPGSCEQGMQRLLEKLRSSAPPPAGLHSQDFWRQLAQWGALGADYSAVPNLAAVSIWIEYEAIETP
jgi:hypothetical protein